MGTHTVCQGDNMKIANKAGIACLAIALASVAFGQSQPSMATGGVPLLTLIETVSKKSDKHFIVDPRVSGDAHLVGIDPSKITYAELLTVLQVHGYTASESNGIVRVAPDTMARTMPTPLIGANDKRPDAEMVSRILRVRSVPATNLVPILRSLLPQSAHLAALQCTNELIIVDTFANVRRIENIVASMDKGSALELPKCTIREPQPPGGSPPPPAPPAR
jgi:general secretion pathway protein D